MKQFLILASTFLFASCVDIERGNPEDPGSRNYNINRLSSSLSVEVSSSSEPSSSSSSVPQSSSSVVASSSSGVEYSSSVVVVSSSSVEMSSSSAMESSSSSMLSSSSSALPSSSSVMPSSSSVVVYSSSSKLSSSSIVQSSSSAMVPSSSSVCTASNNTKTHYCSNGTMKEYGSMTDGVQTYKTIEIGTQTWMAENMNYNATNSRCYGDDTGGDSQGNCAIYGRLYYASGYCPSGWHLPSLAEWNTLIATVGGVSTAGTKLKATNGWNNSGNGQDAYGFAALPGAPDPRVIVGDHGCWWTTSDASDSAPQGSMYYQCMTYNSESVYKGYSNYYTWRSVRCLKN